MADKPVVNTFVSNANIPVTELNENFENLATAIENGLGRGGTAESPNSMQGVLDMNLNKIQNLGVPANPNDAIRLVDLSDSDATGAASAQLRSDLASAETGYGIDLVGGSIRRVDTIASLRGIFGRFAGDAAQPLGYYDAGDGGGGSVRVWKTGAAGEYVDNGGSIIVPTGGDGSGAWVWDREYVVHAAELGGDQAAIDYIVANAPDNGTVVLSGESTTSSGIVVPTNSNVSICGDMAARITASASSISLISIAQNITRGHLRRFSGITLDASTQTGVNGFVFSGSNIGATIQSIYAKNCEVGIDIGPSMEIVMSQCASYLCDVGFRVKPTTTGGGGNANTIVGSMAQSSSKVGFLFDGSNFAPTHNNTLVNPLIQSNECGIAVLGNSALNIVGAHFEDNGGTNPAADVVSFDGHTIPAVPLYIKDSRVSLSNCEIAETANVFCDMEGPSTLYLNNVWGYGTPSGTLIRGDDTNKVFWSGATKPAGVVTARIMEWPTLWGVSSRFSAAGEPTSFVCDTVTNLYSTQNPAYPKLENQIGTLGTVPVAQDPEYGLCSQVVFDAIAGSVSTNRVTITAFPTGITAGDYWITSFLVKASAPTSVTFSAASGSHAEISREITGNWTRIVMMFTAANSTNTALYVYPNDNVGATLSFARIHSHMGTDESDFVGNASLLMKGAFNPNAKKSLYGDSAPSSGSWNAGDVIWDSTPSASGYMGWVCVLSGTPGTWKTFAPISA